jgi:oligoribonuclease NrnB/cAMP/cGMP phosphodiesterase (DHH superfamily)
LNHKYFTINFRGHKGILTFSLGNTSIVGNGILRANDDIDFVIDVGGRGTLSLRADDKINVSILAKELAGGGGHPNASGGRFKHFKDKFLYSDVKDFMETELRNIEPNSAIPLNTH